MDTATKYKKMDNKKTQKTINIVNPWQSILRALRKAVVSVVYECLDECVQIHINLKGLCAFIQMHFS